MLLLIVMLVYNYQQILFLPPGVIHQWRQCDGLSFATNYYEEGFHLFNPAIHWSGLDGTGKATSEFPILYYLVALIWKITGKSELVFRLVNLIIVTLGLFFLFRFIEKRLKDSVWGILITLFVFSSPVLAYYSNNFLMDTPALALTFIAWYFFGEYYESGNIKHFNRSMLFFLIAGLLKITTAISLVALIVIFFLELLGILKFRKEKKIFVEPIKLVPAFIFVVIILFAWYSYAAYYNSIHNRGVFLMTILPIWDKTQAEIIAGLDVFLGGMMLPQFLNIEALIFIGLLFVLQIFLFRKTNKLFFIITLLLFFAVISYLCLWFGVLPENHDYYLILPQIFVVFVLLSFFILFKERNEKIFASNWVKIIFLLFLGLNIYNAGAKTAVKYFNTPDYDDYPKSYSKENKDFINWLKNDFKYLKSTCREVTPYLRQLGISRNDKVISIPDASTNITLYYMDQKGYTDFGAPFPREINWFNQKILNDSVKYLIVHDPTVLIDPAVVPFTQHLVGEYKNIKIFDLTKPIVEVNQSFFFDFEKFDGIGNAHTIISSEDCFGTKCCSLTDGTEFGPIFSFESTNCKDFSAIKSIELDFKTMIPNYPKDLMFVFQVTDSLKNILLWDKILIETKSLDWYNCHYSYNLKGQQLKGNKLEIFIWNKGKTVALFDDVNITLRGYK